MRLGILDVDKIKKGLTAKKFIEWECYARLEPFNELRADQRAALIASTIFNMAVDPKHRKKLEDFLLKFEEREATPKKQTPKQQFEMLKLLAAAYSTDDGTPPRGVDREVSTEMREQVKRAHDAMVKGQIQ